MKQRLHEMMCSQEEPTGEFLDKLIPTGSASMKNAIEKIRKPLMQMLQVRIIRDRKSRLDETGPIKSQKRENPK